MKKLLLLTMASLVTVFAMAIGDNSGSTKANAIDFDWENATPHESATPLWYRVDLAPLYEEENPSLTLFLTNPSRDNSVDVKMVATVAGQKEEKEYTIAPHANKSYTANAATLVRMKQTEIYLTLSATGKILLSAKVYESADLDESCKDARELKWNTLTSQTKGYAAWWKVNIKSIKEAANTAQKKDAKITIKNTGNGELTLKAGQSLDCPSSGLTKREYKVAAGESLIDTVPSAMIANVLLDELYFSIENDQPVQMLVEAIDQPEETVFDVCNGGFVELPVGGIDTYASFDVAKGKKVYRLSVAAANAEKKYEPEFTFRNTGATAVKMTMGMAFECAPHSISTSEYTIPANDEQIVVFKKNMFEGLSEDVQFIYLQIEAEEDLAGLARLKHVREGKACKTNIDFNWETGHRQDARTTQWYAVDLKQAKADKKDVTVYIQNEGSAEATVKASMAFSCPYIDLQEITRKLAAGSKASRKLTYSAYAMMGDTVWIGLETNEDLKIWADTTDTKTKEPDLKCQDAREFNWEDGVRQQANDTVWYKLDMEKVRGLEKFPTVYVYNLGDSKATVFGELSLECPDEIENEKRSISIAARGTWSKELSRNLFEHITQPEIYIRVVATQDINIEVRFTEEAEGSSCGSAIKFNWELGNDQAADANLWYFIDLKDKKAGDKDLYITLKNKDNAECSGAVWLAFTCPWESQQIQKFKLGAKATKSKLLPHSMLETVNDTLYIRVIANTAVHFEAKDSTPADFDTIYCEGITFKELKWNDTVQHAAGTSWYIIPKEVLQQLEGLTLTPEAWVHNLGTGSNKVKAEFAYHCPITATMMSKTKTLSRGQEMTKLIERGTIEQVMQKDSVLIRITSTQDFEFSANLVNPNTGNDRDHAVRLAMDTAYVQEANTVMWYKIDTKLLKSDPTLHGKSLHVEGKNEGAGKANIKVEVFEDVSNDDLLEGHGKKTAPAGKKVSKNIPAYVVYGLGDAELYVKVTTNQTISLSSKLRDYAAGSDRSQKNAILAVPNVDYNIPVGTTWYQVCVPYIRNNYSLGDQSNVIFRNLSSEKATVTVTATWQDELSFDIPERTRTIAGGKSVNKTWKELIDKAIKKAGFDYSIEGTQTSYIEEMLRKYLTSDSITAYIRVTTDKPLFARVNLPETTTYDCNNYMTFDWEHGNVNPEGDPNWYKVFFGYQLDAEGKPAKDADDNIIIDHVPAGNDLLLHFDVEDWGGVPTTVDVKLKELCESDPLVEISNKTLNADTTKLISRKVLEAWQSDLLIEFKSDKTAHIWAEPVPQDIKDTLVVLDSVYVCPGEKVTDKNGVEHEIKADDPLSWTWTTDFDSISDEDATYILFHYEYHVLPLQQPELIPMDQLTNIPTVERGKPIDCSAAIDEIYDALVAAIEDSIMSVKKEDIVWMYSTDGGSSFKPVPTTNAKTEQVKLYYKVTTECGDVIESDTIKNTAVDSLVVSDACNYYQWTAGNDSVYKTSTRDTLFFPVNDPVPDSISILVLTVKNDVVMHVAASQKYGNRLLMINRNAMNDSIKKYMPDEYEQLVLDSLEEAGVESLVRWYRVDDETDPSPERVGTGYYITNPNGLGDPMPSGMYYAVATIPSLKPGECPFILYTDLLDCRVTDTSNPAPALAPTLARPDEQIRILNLDPEQETIIRVYTSEGFRIGAYNVSGESTFQMKAAAERGIYLVEINCDGMKSTLRYIVK